MATPPVPSKAKWAAFWAAIVAAFALLGISVSYKAPAPTPAVTTVSPSTATTAPSTAVSTTTATSPPVAVAAVTAGLPGDVFGPTSWLRQSVANAPAAANSAAVVANLTHQVTSLYNGHAAVNAYDYDLPMYTVPANQPTVNVAFDDCQNKGYLDDTFGAALKGVPLPPGAAPAVGTDSSIGVYQPSTDTLWEFWVVRHTTSGWSACWGGRLDHVSTAPGFFPNGTGVAASGLSYAGIQVRPDEIRSGVITHAVGIAAFTNASWPTWSWPAQRTDGYNPGNDANVPMEGQRFRLDPTFNCTTLPTAFGVALCKAAQTYGLVDVDTAGAVAVMAEPGVQGAASPWDALFGNTPTYNQLAGFPWSRLTALQKDWGKP